MSTVHDWAAPLENGTTIEGIAEAATKDGGDFWEMLSATRTAHGRDA